MKWILQNPKDFGLVQAEISHDTFWGYAITATTLGQELLFSSGHTSLHMTKRRFQSKHPSKFKPLWRKVEHPTLMACPGCKHEHLMNTGHLIQLKTDKTPIELMRCVKCRRLMMKKDDIWEPLNKALSKPSLKKRG